MHHLTEMGYKIPNILFLLKTTLRRRDNGKAPALVPNSPLG